MSLLGCAVEDGCGGGDEVEDWLAANNSEILAPKNEVEEVEEEEEAMCCIIGGA